MAFQLCPKCNGTGMSNNITTQYVFSSECNLCKGTMIISENTGLPPKRKKSNIHEESDNFLDLVEKMKDFPLDSFGTIKTFSNRTDVSNTYPNTTISCITTYKNNPFTLT